MCMGAPRARAVSLVFALFVVTDVLLSVDSGALPVALPSVTARFELSRFGQGTVGALSPAGFAGAVTSVGVLLTRRSPRRLLVAGLAATAASSAAFAAAQSTTVLLVSRALYGVAYAVFFVFAPVWVSLFAPEDRATSWISVIQAGAPIGAVLGMVLAGVVAGHDGSWRVTFVLQAVCIGVCTACFASVPSRLVDGDPPVSGEVQSRDEFTLEDDPLVEGEVDDGRGSADGGAVSIDGSVESDSARVGDEASDEDTRRRRRPRTDGDLEAGVPAAVDADGGDPYLRDRPIVRVLGGQQGLALEADGIASVLAPSPRQQLATLAANKVFVFASLALGFLTFTVEGIRYWVVLYRTEVFQDDLSVVVASFTLVSSTAPILGMFLGGGVIDRSGGYRSKDGVARSLRILMFFSLCAGPSAAAMLISDLGRRSSLRVFCAFTWLLLFFGGAHVAPLTGILISVVPQEMRSLSSAVSLLVNHVIGYFFAPFGIGILANARGIKLGFQAIVSASAIAISFCFFAWVEAEKEAAAVRAKKRRRAVGMRRSGSSADNVGVVALLAS